MTTDPDDVYLWCPDCGFISQPTSMSYVRASDGGIDWSRPVEACCQVCHSVLSPGPGDAPPLDDVMTCSRCQAAAPCPAGAARVRCPECGLFLTGHRLTGPQHEALRTAERHAATSLRTRWLIAKQAARQHGTLPSFLDIPPEGGTPGDQHPR
jgi:hypothetical protein